MELNPKIIRASLVAPLAVLILPAIMAILAIVADYFEYFGNDPADDAPVRAAGIILIVLIPLAYPILAVSMCTIGYALKHAKKLTLKSLFIICGAISIPLGIRMGWESPYGIKDQLIGLLIFLPFTIFCLFCGAYCWWYIANLGQLSKREKA